MSWFNQSNKEILKRYKVTNKEALHRVRNSAPTAILLRHFNQNTFVTWLENNYESFYSKRRFNDWRFNFLYLDSEQRKHGDHNKVLRTFKKDLGSFLGIESGLVEIIITKYLAYLKQELIFALMRDPNGLFDGYVQESEKMTYGFIKTKK